MFNFFDIINLGMVIFMINSNGKIEVTVDYRLKLINFLKNYGYYNGLLVKMNIQRKYISGELNLVDIIHNKHDYKELKLSIKAVLRYCHENGFDDLFRLVEYFYKIECLEIRKKYGGFFDRMSFF